MESFFDLPLRDAQTLQQAQSLGHWGPTYSLDRGGGLNLARCWFELGMMSPELSY